MRLHILLPQVAEGDEEEIEDGEDEESAGVLDDETDEYDGTSPETGAAILNPTQEVIKLRQQVLIDMPTNFALT